MGYDDANKFGRRNESQIVTGTGTPGGFVSKQRRKAVAAHCRVMVAGTAAGAVLTFQNGTASIGSVVLGTSAIATKTSVDLGDAVIDSGEAMAVVITSDATIRAAVGFEFDVLPDSAFSS